MTLRAVGLDCDGVILESFDIKTRAFRQLFADRPAHVEAILQYHLANGGTSRYEKLRYVHERILREPLSVEAEARLGERFASLVVDEVLRSRFVPGAEEFLREYAGRLPLFVVSGTPEEELRLIVERRGLREHFRGVYGSPRRKEEILRGILSAHRWQPAELLFVGDAFNDWQAAAAAGVVFVGRVAHGTANPFPRVGPVAVVSDLQALSDWLRNVMPLAPAPPRTS
jgi:HAD superfamily hydrolase (TIGR01549 family)